MEHVSGGFITKSVFCSQYLTTPPSFQIVFKYRSIFINHQRPPYHPLLLITHLQLNLMNAKEAAAQRALIYTRIL